jgi:creatinine amidohydrolase/Fe(II)-dependent formamide hydrolase-like protein
MDKNLNIKILAQPEYEGVSVDGQTPADHAGKWETSMFWHLYPDKTRMKDFAMETGRKMIYENPPHDYYQEQEEWVWKEDLRQAASRELGEKAIDIISDYLKGKILALLDEADNR